MYAVASTAFSGVGREPLGIVMLLGLRTVIYRAPDLAAGKQWYTKFLGFGPYFDQPFYVGFNVGGYELGLLPDATQSTVGAYWGVKGIDGVYARLLELGATPRSEIADVGEGIRIADVLDPFGNVLGIIDNPNFKPAEIK
jgi:catechol 2,3-dioxygenase-like lactoylglutathione lyase family enzyme